MMVSELNSSLNKPKVYKIKRVKSKVVKKPNKYQIGGIEFERDTLGEPIIRSTFVPEVYQDEMDRNSWNQNFIVMMNFMNLFEHTYEDCKFKKMVIHCDEKTHSGAYYHLPNTPGNGDYFTMKDLSITYDDFDIHQIPEYKTYTDDIHMSVTLMYSNSRSRYVCVCIPYVKDTSHEEFKSFTRGKEEDKLDAEHRKMVINDMIEKINEYFSKAYGMVFFSLTKKV